MSFKKLVCFTNDAGGLEKILRLLQSIAQICAAYSWSVDGVVYWMYLRKQFALGRRYFRFFKFIGCFQRAFDSVSSFSGFEALLEVGKWSFMGCYLGLESITILDALGVWPTPLAEVCMLHANRFWLYALLCSICISLRTVHHHPRIAVVSVDGKTQKVRYDHGRLKGIKRKVVADAFDMIIPGHVTGWIPSSIGIVGAASVVSTVLGMVEIWDGLNS